MTCTATPRRTFYDAGWTCTGEDLVTVMRSEGLPVVVPRCLLDVALAEPWAAAYDPPELFPGGDHYHLVVDRTISA